jgi:hypothetical protein
MLTSPFAVGRHQILLTVKEQNHVPARPVTRRRNSLYRLWCELTTDLGRRLSQTIQKKVEYRFELPLNGGDVAAAYCRVENDRLVVIHVPGAVSVHRTGIGS